MADRPGAHFRLQRPRGQSQALAHRRIQIAQMNDPNGVPKQVAERLAGEVDVDGPAGHAAEVPQTIQRPLEFADVAAQLLSQEFEYIFPNYCMRPRRLRAQEIE